MIAIKLMIAPTNAYKTIPSRPVLAHKIQLTRSSHNFKRYEMGFGLWMSFLKYFLTVYLQNELPINP